MKLNSVPVNVVTEGDSRLELSVSRALVAHSIKPILKSLRKSSKQINPSQKVIPLLRQPRFLHFVVPPPIIFDNLGLIRRYISHFRALVAYPVVPNNSATQQFTIWFSKAGNDDFKCDNNKSVAAVNDSSIDIDCDDIEIIVVTDDDSPPCTPPSIVLEDNNNNSLPSFCDTKRSIKSIGNLPNLTVTTKLAPVQQTFTAVKRTLKHEILITPVTSLPLSNVSLSGLAPKYMVPNRKGSSSALPAMKFTTSCLVVQCLPDITYTGVPQQSAKPHTNVAPNFAQTSSPTGLGATKITKRSPNILRPTTVPTQDKPNNKVVAQKRKAAAPKKCSSMPKNALYTNYNIVYHSAMKSSSDVKVPRQSNRSLQPQSNTSQTPNSSALPFLSDQISYFPVNSTSRACDCRSGIRRFWNPPKRPLENDICADCCERDRGNGQYLDHDSVSLIPIYDDANQIVTIDSSDNDSNCSEEYYIVNPKETPTKSNIATQCEINNIRSQCSEINSNRCNSMSIKRTQQISKSIVKQKSIDNERSPPTSTTASNFQSVLKSSNAASERENSLQLLRQVLRQHIPFTQNQTQSDSSHQKMQCLDDGDTTSATNHMQLLRLPSISTFQLHQHCNTTTITMVSRSTATSTYQSCTQTVNILNVGQSNNANIPNQSCSQHLLSSLSIFPLVHDTYKHTNTSPQSFTSTATSKPLAQRQVNETNYPCSQDPWTGVGDQENQFEGIFHDIMEFLDEEAQRDRIISGVAYSNEYGSTDVNANHEVCSSMKSQKYIQESPPTRMSAPTTPTATPTVPTAAPSHPNKRKTLPTPKMSTYARQLLAHKTKAEKLQRTKEERKAKAAANKTHSEHPTIGDSLVADTTSLTKRKVQCCPSPILLPAAKRQNQFNEIDITMRVESAEFSLESLDEIPIDQLFVPGEGFNINDYM